MELIYKIVPRAEWECATNLYEGSPHDRADGFLHFSTREQLPETLRLYYNGQDDLILVAVDAAALGAALKYEHAPSRNQDFPHLFGALPLSAVRWTKPLRRDANVEFLLPPMTKVELLAGICTNPINSAILTRLPDLGLPDAWLVSGALFQTLWNMQTDRPSTTGIKDYDIFYFDPDTSFAAEDAAISKTKDHFADLDCVIEVRNQARVHLWYEDKFHKPYPALARATDGIDRFLMCCAQIGVQPGTSGTRIYAPNGFEDIFGMIVRPNYTANFDANRYLEKAQRWQSLWPQISIIQVSSEDA